MLTTMALSCDRYPMTAACESDRSFSKVKMELGYDVLLDSTLLERRNGKFQQ